MEHIIGITLRRKTDYSIKTTWSIPVICLLYILVITTVSHHPHARIPWEESASLTAMTDSIEKEELLPEILPSRPGTENTVIPSGITRMIETNRKILSGPDLGEKIMTEETGAAQPAVSPAEPTNTTACNTEERNPNIPKTAPNSPAVPSQEAEDSTVVLTGITCRTALRQDYCVGSTETVPALEVYAQRSDGSTQKLETGSYQTGSLDTTSAGSKTLSVRYGDYEIELPYQVVEYTITLHPNGGNYPVDCLTARDYRAKLPGDPKKVGCQSGSWYYDEACTIPVKTDQLTLAAGQTHMDLYAGYEETGGFILDEEGYVIGYEGEMTDTLMLPEHCVGVRAGAFSEEAAGAVKYVYIPANVADIEPGAFRAMRGVKDYLVIAEGNPAYCSINGMIVSRDESRLCVYPAGRRGEDYLPDTITCIEDYAFYGASLSALVIETEEPPTLKGAHCFSNCNVTFLVSGSCLEQYRESFIEYGLNERVEEMD
ncbi:MAG: hypothetical protein ACOYBL_04475 [Lachnospiraceae bacterium]|jgi:hypothetical protein